MEERRAYIAHIAMFFLSSGLGGDSGESHDCEGGDIAESYVVISTARVIPSALAVDCGFQGFVCSSIDRYSPPMSN